MIQRMKSIIYLCRLTCASCLPLLRTSGYEIVWALGFELGSSVDMVLLSLVGFLFVYYISMLLVLALVHSLCAWEVYLVGVFFVDVLFLGYIYALILVYTYALLSGPEILGSLYSSSSEV